MEHYSCNRAKVNGVHQYRPLGRTVLRHRLLRAQGWAVCDIPWFEWNAAQEPEGAGGLPEGALRAGAAEPAQCRRGGRRRLSCLTVGCSTCGLISWLEYLHDLCSDDAAMMEVHAWLSALWCLQHRLHQQRMRDVQMIVVGKQRGQ